MRAAVFDIGSNSVKLLIAEKSGVRTRVLEDRSCVTRLAEGLAKSGRLAPNARVRTLRVLEILNAQTLLHKTSSKIAVATSAVRDSANGRAFLREASQILGCPVRCISGKREASLIFAGVAHDPFWRGRDLVTLDIGGGSCEWTQSKAGVLERCLSLPLGSVRLRERFIPRYPVSASAMAALEQEVGADIPKALRSFSLKGRVFVGSGGAITMLAAAMSGLRKWDAAQIDHAVLGFEDLCKLQTRLCRMPLSKIKKMPGVPPERADLAVPALVTVLATMKVLGARSMKVTTRGLRYGVWHALQAD